MKSVALAGAVCRPRIAAVLLLGGCGSDSLTPILGCESGFGIDVDCRFQSPEDMALSPDGRIIVSQFGGMDGNPGSLVLYEPPKGNLTALFPDPSVRMKPEWGDPACALADAFSPHGIDIETRSDGRHQLAVVNHGGRESVELFEVDADGALTWRGCAEAPEDGLLNDVVVLRDGGFWVTRMFDRGGDTWAFLRAQFGFDTGWAYAWSQAEGFRKLPGSDAAFPNGIEKSDDERFAYLNTFTGARKIDVPTGEVVAERSMKPLDNGYWSEDGRLLVASHTGSIPEMLACMSVPEGACGMPFEIVALDPDDLSEQVIIAHEGAPMGGATVALQRDGIYYLGTFAGDRLGVVDLSPWPAGDQRKP
ncbi:MAG: hypothetical protein OXH52_00150 [Gammaproteobacteria bacterium]|nr:hypothetical protein [Gammaproteobacteria bacterium]